MIQRTFGLTNSGRREKMRSKEEIQTLKTSFRMPYDILHQVRFI